MPRLFWILIILCVSHGLWSRRIIMCACARDKKFVGEKNIAAGGGGGGHCHIDGDGDVPLNRV